MPSPYHKRTLSTRMLLDLSTACPATAGSASAVTVCLIDRLNWPTFPQGKTAWRCLKPVRAGHLTYRSYKQLPLDQTLPLLVWCHCVRDDKRPPDGHNRRTRRTLPLHKHLFLERLKQPISALRIYVRALGILESFWIGSGVPDG